MPAERRFVYVAFAAELPDIAYWGTIAQSEGRGVRDGFILGGGLAVDEPGVDFGIGWDVFGWDAHLFQGRAEFGWLDIW